MTHSSLCGILISNNYHPANHVGKNVKKHMHTLDCAHVFN